MERMDLLRSRIYSSVCWKEEKKKKNEISKLIEHLHFVIMFILKWDREFSYVDFELILTICFFPLCEIR